MREFTALENELFNILDMRDIDENYYDICVTAFSTDEALSKAIAWLKNNPDFSNVDLSRLIGEYGVESEDFSLTTEFDEEE